jgi:hypothetical protein
MNTRSTPSTGWTGFVAGVAVIIANRLFSFTATSSLLPAHDRKCFQPSRSSSPAFDQACVGFLPALWHPAKLFMLQVMRGRYWLVS